MFQYGGIGPGNVDVRGVAGTLLFEADSNLIVFSCPTVVCLPSNACSCLSVWVSTSNSIITVNIVATKNGMTNINGVAYLPAKSNWHDVRPLAAVSVAQKIILTEPAKTIGSAASLRTVMNSGRG